MILIGNDIVETHRIQNLIEKYKDAFLNRIFTNEEKLYCKSRAHPEIHFSGRFAAKEAVKKILLQENPNSFVPLRNIEIFRDADNLPIIRIKNYPDKKIQISISHTDNYATAVALLEVK